ncbi:uncharacterized protein A4U43_C08F7960 [Asparagus officinalis]|nr:uncharacterized protein A4U43_C08F7960 [Asparagus officinalis]
MTRMFAAYGFVCAGAYQPFDSVHVGECRWPITFGKRDRAGSGRLKRVKNNFKDLDEHIKVFEPLLFEEVKAQITPLLFEEVKAQITPLLFEEVKAQITQQNDEEEG